MKKLRRVTALIGVIALVALYVSTLVLALIGGENMMNVFWAAIVATIVLPVLLWAYSFIYKLLKRDYSEQARADEKKMREAYLKREQEEGEDFYRKMNEEEPKAEEKTEDP